MVATTAAPEISPSLLVPELLRRYPQTRSVLDRYGLRGCGGASGPHESLAFFARMHGVDETTLLREVQASVDVRARPLPVAPNVADSIYRRFFVAGILSVLTVGAAWGVWLLWQIGFAQNFTGVSIHDVNAHGHAQIFGWVGLFIMGFGYQALPRFWQTSLAAPKLAVAAFVAMLVGIVVTTGAMWLHARPWAAEVALAGGLLELLAICTFAVQLGVTLRRSRVPMEPYIAFILAGLGFFIFQAAFGVWHGWTTMTAATREVLLYHVQVYQAVLRDLQIHGMALLMILGVSLRLLPGALGLERVPNRRAWMVFALLLIGVVGECVLFLAYGWTGHHAFAGALLLPWLLLAVGSLLIPWKWRLWRPIADADRSTKFIQFAYAWLAISMVMLLLLPVYALVSGIAFSHAYYGAIRHAITVGFISLMIMGVAAKVVPTLNGFDVRRLGGLWGPFILVNVGCLLRVSLQTLTDWHPLFFSIVGISGLLELAGLTWWGLHLIALMRRGKRGDIADHNDAPAPTSIKADHRVADVLRWFPRTQEAFDALGFSLIRNPVMRRTVARQVTLSQAASMRGVSLEMMLDKLNAAAGTLRPADLNLAYDARIGDLLDRHPSLRHTLDEFGVAPADCGSLTIEALAERLGLPREHLVIGFAQALVTSHAGSGCSGHCDSCDHS